MSNDRIALRIGAFGAIVGGLLGIVGNLLHPRESGSLDSVEGFLEEGTLALWVGDHLVLMAGLALILPALYGLSRSLTSPDSHEWGRFAFAAGTAAIAYALVLITHDTLAISNLAEQWESSANPDLAVIAATSAVSFNFAMFTGLMLFVFGVVPVLYGVAMLKGDDYATWLGWVGVVFGGLSFVAGVIQAFAGAIALTAFVLFPIGAIVITLWLIYLGVLMNRKARDLAKQTVAA